MYLYIKALHIIFVVTWFAGLFYVVRLFIYNTEAEQRQEPIRSALRDQFSIMIRRLWFGITWPSGILTLIFGLWIWTLYGATPHWLFLKLCFVAGLFLYHYSLHRIVRQELQGTFKYTSDQLRLWNELATVFLVAIVMLVVVKESLSFVWGLLGLALLVGLLFAGMRLYKRTRSAAHH